MQFAPLLPAGADERYQALLVQPGQLHITDTVLGCGAFGTVCLGSLDLEMGAPLLHGLHARSGRDACKTAKGSVTVAVKTTPAELSGNALSQLLLEARLHACLSHCNIVALLAVQEAYLPVMLALAYCSGGDLRQELRRRAAASAIPSAIPSAMPSAIPSAIPSAKASAAAALIHTASPVSSSTGVSEAGRRDMASQVAAGLQYLHSKLCIHRDVAARNVLLVPQSEAGAGEQAGASGFVLKLADLGLSRVTRDEQDYYRVSGKEVQGPGDKGLTEEHTKPLEAHGEERRSIGMLPVLRDTLRLA